MKKQTIEQKQARANRIINDINREILDRQFILERINSTHGAAQAYYREEYKKVEKKITDWRDELDALGQVN